MKYGALMYRVGWISMMRQACAPISSVAYKVILENGLCSLPGGMNISLKELLKCMDCTFGNMHNYDSMIRSLYEICQKENESIEEYMLRVHEAVAVVKHAYPDQIPNEGEGLRRDRFYYRLTPV